MAVTELEIDTSLLAAGRMGMEEDLSQMQTTLNEVYTQIEELNAMWTGPADQAFRNVFQQDQTRITEIMKELKEFLEHLKEVQYEYEACESSVADIVAAIKI